MKHSFLLLKRLAQYSAMAAIIFFGAATHAQCTDNYEPNQNFGQAKLIGNNTQIFALINPAGDKDFYKFHVNNIHPNLRIILSSVPKNYDLILFDRQQQNIANSKNPGLENDTIILNNAI